MNVNFPINNIKFNFDCKGTGKVTIVCNDKVIDNNIIVYTIMIWLLGVCDKLQS